MWADHKSTYGSTKKHFKSPWVSTGVNDPFESSEIDSCPHLYYYYYLNIDVINIEIISLGYQMTTSQSFCSLLPPPIFLTTALQDFLVFIPSVPLIMGTTVNTMLHIFVSVLSQCRYVQVFQCFNIIWKFLLK